MQWQLVNHVFKLLIQEHQGFTFLHFLHGDSLEKITEGVLALLSAGKENIVYQLAHVLAENKLQMDRMPFGLTDGNIRFFNAQSTVKVKMEEHYALWPQVGLPKLWPYVAV